MQLQRNHLDRESTYGLVHLTEIAHMAITPPLIALPFGLSLQECADPTGNGQDTAEVLYKKTDGSVAHLGIYVQIHGGQIMRALHGNQSGCEGSAELDANGRVQLNEL